MEDKPQYEEKQQSQETPHPHTKQQQKNTSPKHPDETKKKNKKNNLPCLHLAAVEVSKLFLKQYENIFHIYMDAFSNSPTSISPEKARMLRSINKFMSLMS